MHDLLFDNQQHLKVPQLRGLAERLELNIVRYDADMADTLPAARARGTEAGAQRRARDALVLLEWCHRGRIGRMQRLFDRVERTTPVNDRTWTAPDGRCHHPPDQRGGLRSRQDFVSALAGERLSAPDVGKAALPGEIKRFTDIDPRARWRSCTMPVAGREARSRARYVKDEARRAGGVRDRACRRLAGRGLGTSSSRAAPAARAHGVRRAVATTMSTRGNAGAGAPDGLRSPDPASPSITNLTLELGETPGHSAGAQMLISA